MFLLWLKEPLPFGKTPPSFLIYFPAPLFTYRLFITWLGLILRSIILHSNITLPGQLLMLYICCMLGKSLVSEFLLVMQLLEAQEVSQEGGQASPPFTI